MEKILRAAHRGEAVLDLADFGLAELPKEIGLCVGLQTLSLDNNQLKALPEEIGRCVDLHTLTLDNNQLTALPKEIGLCVNLRTLSLNNNRLEALPKEIVHCTNLRELSIRENPKLGLPPDVLGSALNEAVPRETTSAQPKAILDYYFSRRLGESQPLNEVKLVFVGRGGAGKTSLVERLVWNTFQPGQRETLGVSLSDWEMQGCAGGMVTAHVWDFAGQTITHAMHQFFLSVRTVYVLVLTGRENSERDDAEYWLRLIAAYGTEGGSNGPPVIVALNKWDDQGSARPKLDRIRLQERYPFVIKFVETDCSTGTGISILRELLCATVNPLPWVRADFPNDYRRVKDRLEAVPSPHLPYDEYRRICSECGVAEEERQDLLAENLHALGVALNFRKDPRLSFASVLKPHWLTDHVYALMRHAELEAGVLHRTALADVLADEKDPAIRQFLVEMMVRFELAYPISDEGAMPTAWLVPQALPDSQPTGMTVFRQSQHSTRLRYTYRALPVSIVPRFIVRTHPFIEDELRWASGVVLTLNGARALVRADYTEKQVEVMVIGLTEVRRELMGLVQQEFRYINGQITGLNPLEEAEEQGEWVSLKTLEHDETAKRKTGLATEAGTLEMDPAKKLNEFSAPAARDASWKPRVFISYSHTDEAQRKKLELYLKVLVTHGALHEKWDDHKIQPGEGWDRAIKMALATADVVLLLVSAAALASDYIRTVEMNSALSRAAAGKAVVIPIILEDCPWKLPELRNIQVLPSGARPVRDWTPQSRGWNNVSAGLLTVFEGLRKEHQTA